MQPKLDVDRVRAPGFALAEALVPSVSEWHAHRKHQLLYACSGTLHLEADGKQWLLPPQRAAWVRARCEHRVRASRPVSLRTLYIDNALVAHLDPLRSVSCCVFRATALVREMILYGMRWSADRDPDDSIATRFFITCAEVCAQAVEQELPLWLPSAKTSELARAMEITVARLGERISQGDVARAAAMSERTLLRRFQQETQMTWRDFLRTARLLKAMELLATPGARVNETAAKVGFDSVPAFIRAFERLAGESPSAYRGRQAERRD